MAIIRGDRPDSNFYVLDKAVSEDDRLSWAARGLLIYLLGKPDSWSVSVEHLQRQTENSAKHTGRDGVYALLKELVNLGYVTRVQTRDATGKMSGHDYIVSERPALPLTALPLTALPLTADTTLVSIENTSKDLERTKEADKSATLVARKKNLQNWIETERHEGRKLITSDDPIYSDGIPRPYIVLAWKVFVETIKPTKLQLDWRKTFRNYVRNDYLRLWSITRDGQYYLTTAGKQAAMRHNMGELTNG